MRFCKVIGEGFSPLDDFAQHAVIRSTSSRGDRMLGEIIERGESFSNNFTESH
jgi:hypothetical protein